MRLFFDARYIRTDTHDGISRFTTELAAAVQPLADVTYLICDDGQKKFLPLQAQTLMFHAPTSVKEPFSSMLLNKHHPDVLFSPMQTIGTMGRRFKAIVTSHDMIYYHHRTPPQHVSWILRVGWRLYHLSYWPQRIALNSADLVATISETVKAEFLKAHLTKRQIIILPNAPQQFTITPDIKKTPQHLIYMGSFMPYKNVETLIEAMAELPDKTLHLLSRISPQRKAELEARIPKEVKAIFHNGVSDDEYQQLLADRAILVTASRREGYGLPIAEALAAGVPAVISDIPIFHEVAGNGALYADVNTPVAFAAAIRQLDDAAVRSRIVKEGKQHIAQFSWHESASRLVSAAKSLL